MKKLTTFISLCVLLGSNLASGATVLTGADLLNAPGVTFPTTQPILSGSSIVFGPGDKFTKLVVIPIFGAGTLPGSGIVPFSFSINMTRLTGDWDPRFGLTDGISVVGAVIGDNEGGSAAALRMVDNGNSAICCWEIPTFNNAGYPDIGQAVDIDFTLMLNLTSTNTSVGFFGYSGAADLAAGLDRSRDISLAIFRDNDGSEQYQINSITLPSAVPIPATVWLLGSGLLGLIGAARRKR